MPSTLERRIAAHRAAVLSRDEAVLRTLVAAFERVVVSLETEVAVLTRQLAADGLLAGGLDGTAASGKLFRLERYKALLRQADDELARLMPAVARMIRAEQLALVRFGAGSAEALVAASLGSEAGIVAGFNRLPVSALTDLVGITQSGAPLGQALARYGPAASRIITADLLDGMAKGTSPDAIAALIRNKLVVLGGGIDAAGVPKLGYLQGLARTSMLTSYRTASIRTYGENADILDGWVWTCAFSELTCESCLSLDGTLFPLTETFMASHPRCRCSTRPAVKGETAAPLETGAEWFERQDAATQDRMLGGAGGAAYRTGDVRLSDFVTTGTDKTHGWIGEHYRADSLSGAMARAEARTGRAAA